MKFFIDTYGLIEIAKGSKLYERFLDCDAITLEINLAETYYVLCNRYDEKSAKSFFNIFSKMVFDFPQDIIQRAMDIRLKNKDKHWSYTDSIGYAFALENNMIFVTGDRAFKGMDNVEIIR